MPKQKKNNYLGPRPYQVSIMLKAQVPAITTFTPEGADPPENNICSSYRSGMTRLVLVQEHLDCSEGATTPSPTYTMPPELRVVAAPRHLPLLSEKNDRTRPKAIIENDILFIAIANCDNICRFDNMTPASRCRLMAAAIACSLPSSSAQNDGEQSSSRADSGAPTNSRKRG